MFPAPSNPDRLRRQRKRSRLAIALATTALAVSTAAGTAMANPAGSGLSATADQHPASQGWVQVDNQWVQIQPQKPHSMPDEQQAAAMKAAASATTAGHTVQYNEYDLPMTYHGGQDSIGVTTGPPRVYLIYWGSQWGSQGTDSTGHTTLSGDPEGVAPYQQDFFQGLGSDNDAWSSVLTQYCEGTASGTTACPAGAAHVGYPQAGQTLAGIWADTSAPAPQAANEPQIAAEVAKAAQHFGNLNPAQNRNVQYIINTSQGTDPDSWQQLGYCAWHTYEKSSYGELAYTLMPYLTDNKYCGTNWINPGARGQLDGYGIIGGHEYAETITDQDAIGAWTDATGQEVGDKCAWIPEGENGGLFNLTLATGVFPVQTMWSNSDHLCMGTDPKITNTPVVINTLCDRTSPLNSPVDQWAIATDSENSPLTYSATGLPPGLRINRSTGEITGSTKAKGYKDVHLTATDAAGHSASSSFRWGFFTTGLMGCAAIEQLVDPGFENGSAVVDGTSMTGAWNPSGYNVITSSTTHQAHSGSWYAWLGQDTASNDSIEQFVETTPGYSKALFSFWLDVDTTNPSKTADDTLQLVLYDQFSGNEIGVVKTWSNLNATSGYQQQTVDLSPWVNKGLGFGSTVGVKLVSQESGSAAQTAFLVDDASFKLY